MGSYVVRATIIPRMAEELSKAESKAKGFAQVLNLLPEDLARELRAHAQYLSDLKAEGKVFCGGPMDDFTEGLIIYKADSLAEAKRFAEGDPYIKSGLFTDYQIKGWHHWI